MAAPTYATDLTTIDLADATTNWAESTDGNWDDGGPPSQETDYYIHNGGTAACISATASVAKGNHSTLIADNGSGVTVPTDGAVLIWCYFQAPNVLQTLSNGGLKMVIGSSLADFYYWNVGGSDFGRNPYGGWENFAVDPAQTQDGTVGTPTGTDRYFGMAHLITSAISKGNPFGVDVVRYGRCEARFTDGDVTNGYCTFAGFAASNDASSARWGLIQAIAGGYLWKGLMTIGYSTKAEFVDSDVNITIDDVRKVSSAFNAIEVRQSTTVLSWTRVNFVSLSSVAPGTFEMIDAADVTLDSCNFTDMATFIFDTTADVLSCTFLRCKTITAAGALMTGSRILLSSVAADASALNWNVNTNPQTYLGSLSFSKGANAHHAIEFGSSAPLSMALVGCDFSGFNASDGQNDSTFYFADRGSDSTWTLSLSGCTGNFTYKKARAGDTVTISSTVLFTVEGLPNGTEVTLIRDSDGVELDHVESSSGDYVYPYSYGGDIAAHLHLNHIDYEWKRVSGITLGSTDQTIPVELAGDRIYANP